MGKAGSGPQREAWRRILGALLAPTVVLVVVVTVLLVISAFVGLSAVYGEVGIHTNGKVTAFLLGFFIAGFLGAIWYGASVFTGGAAWMTGASAERWTAKEFAALGPAWHLFHNVSFVDGFADETWEVDVDHLVVGPYGVLVIESKYSSSPLDLGAVRLPKHLRDAVRQAKDNAGRVCALLHRDAPAVPVRPVVVFWGRLVKAPKEPVRRVETVRIVSGNDAGRWRPLLVMQDVVPQELVVFVSSKIEKHISRGNERLGP